MKKINIKFITISIFAVAIIVSTLFVSVKSVYAKATLIPQEFTVFNQAGIIGYDAGFSLNDAVFNGATSIVIKLYSGNTLLQTNTAQVGKIKGTGFLTPFDVFGTFNYVQDGNFTNVRQGEFGKILAPTKVVATITLADGRTLTATNATLSGDTTTIGVTPIAGQVLGVETFNFTLLLKVNSRGNEVTNLQKYLNSNGYDCGSADGIFGSLTKAEVIKFQIASGLVGDGIVGPLTRAVLNK